MIQASAEYNSIFNILKSI